MNDILQQRLQHHTKGDNSRWKKNPPLVFCFIEFKADIHCI